LVLPRLGISVYFFEKKIYVKRSGSNWQRCRHQQRQQQRQRRSVDCAGKIVADAVAVSFTESKNKTAESQRMLLATCHLPHTTWNFPFATQPASRRSPLSPTSTLSTPSSCYHKMVVEGDTSLQLKEEQEQA